MSRTPIAKNIQTTTTSSELGLFAKIISIHIRFTPENRLIRFDSTGRAIFSYNDSCATAKAQGKSSEIEIMITDK